MASTEEGSLSDLIRTRCPTCGDSAPVKYFLWIKSLPCPSEMTASLHIAGTRSSSMDTVLCARKLGSQPVDVDLPSLQAAVHDQVPMLASAGIEVTDGSLRCVALGLHVVRVVQGLEMGWNAGLRREERLDGARTAFAGGWAEYDSPVRAPRSQATP